MRSFSLQAIWILNSKVNFEVVCLTQFSIFLEKNKIIGYRLFITTLQPLGLGFLDFIIKFLTILYFESFFTSFYLLFFSYMLYNWVLKSYKLSFWCIQNFVYNVDYNFYFFGKHNHQCILMQLQSSQYIQISISKKQNSIFGEFFKSNFVVLHNIFLNTISDDF